MTCLCATTALAPTRRRALLRLAAWACGAGLADTAAALAKPSGAVLLSVSGRVRHANAGATAEFDMAMLAALPQMTLTTRTPWYPAPRKFTGPLLRAVLAAAGAEGTMLRLGALNDYRVDMPFQDPQRYPVVLARLLDDKPMGVREKGPLFVIYPFDQQPELRSPIYYSRSAWQLRTIDVM